MFELYNELYSHYNKAIIHSKNQLVQFENKKGWFTEATLTEELAFWLLVKGIEIKYEEEY